MFTNPCSHMSPVKCYVSGVPCQLTCVRSNILLLFSFFLDHTDEEGGGGQHHCQVDCYGRVEEVWQLEKGCSVADGDKQQRWEKGHHGFVCQFPLKHNIHVDFIVVILRKSWRFRIISDVILSQFFITFKVGLPKNKTNTVFICFIHHQIDMAYLQEIVFLNALFLSQRFDLLLHFLYYLCKLIFLLLRNRFNNIILTQVYPLLVLSG